MRALRQALAGPWPTLVVVVGGTAVVLIVTLAVVMLPATAPAAAWMSEPSDSELPVVSTERQSHGSEDFPWLYVSLPGDGRIRVGDARWLELAELGAAVAGHRGTVHIRAHRNTPWSEVAEVLAALVDGGVHRVAFEARLEGTARRRLFWLDLTRPSPKTLAVPVALGAAAEAIEAALKRAYAERDRKVVFRVDAAPEATYGDVVGTLALLEDVWRHPLVIAGG